MSRNTQAELKDEVLGRIAQAIADVRESLSPLNESQLKWKPAPKTWSVAECLGHLVVSHDAYIPRITAATGSTAHRKPSGHGDHQVGSTLIGKMLFKGVHPDTRRKISAPGVFRPSRANYPGSSVDAFIRCHESLALQVENTAELDWHRIKVVSPASRFIRLRLGNVYRVLAAHAQRHVNQAIRVTEVDKFPSSSTR
ncbi:MAG: DinB family protein [Longimicrobiales bacterium]